MRRLTQFIHINFDIAIKRGINGSLDIKNMFKEWRAWATY